jgi:hypothetical protein
LLIAKVAYVLGWFAAHDVGAPHDTGAPHDAVAPHDAGASGQVRE